MNLMGTTLKFGQEIIIIGNLMYTERKVDYDYII